MFSTRSNIMLPAFGSMRRDFQRALDEVGQNRRMFQDLCPISMWQDDQHIYIHADVPGLSHDEIDLQLEDGRLWIRGERKWFGDNTPFEHNERLFGKFERTVVLSDVIDPSSIDATLESGVLLITLTRKPESRPRSIEIRDKASTVKKLSDDSPGG